MAAMVVPWEGSSTSDASVPRLAFVAGSFGEASIFWLEHGLTFPSRLHLQIPDDSGPPTRCAGPAQDRLMAAAHQAHAVAPQQAYAIPLPPQSPVPAHAAPP
ncbi:hypothetical protein NDU88_004615 [Pleurodeles waltl]|uniref:Uncharacterized protein n=1 Tax=Pleurodeles waltl TaxID=8319 RepID=A0AAV7W9F5_PLEWA|nr:hypothetical protein NDU88_004615 [Pleurodeles waltl]